MVLATWDGSLWVRCSFDRLMAVDRTEVAHASRCAGSVCNVGLPPGCQSTMPKHARIPPTYQIDTTLVQFLVPMAEKSSRPPSQSVVCSFYLSYGLCFLPPRRQNALITCSPRSALSCYRRCRPAEKGTGAFQYFIKLVPTVHSLSATDNGQGTEQVTSLTSQFTYTFKFRSLKGSTEYHTEHEEGEGKGKGKEEGSRRAAALNSMLLPGSWNKQELAPSPRVLLS